MRNTGILIVWAVVAILCEFVNCLGFCGFPCRSGLGPVCGSDGVTYPSYCELISERDCRQPDLEVRRHRKCFTFAQKFGIGIGASTAILTFFCCIPCGIICHLKQTRANSEATPASVWTPGTSVSRQSNNAFYSQDETRSHVNADSMATPASVWTPGASVSRQGNNAFHSCGGRGQTRSHVNADINLTTTGIPLSMLTRADVLPGTRYTESSHNASFPQADVNQTTITGLVPDVNAQAPPPYSDMTLTAAAITPSQPSAPAYQDESLPSYEEVMKTHSLQV